MFRWLRGRDSGKGQKCLGPCRRTVPLSQLVLINHCYHVEVDYRHRSCAAVRLLCLDCHKRIGTYEYYRAFLEAQARQHPDKYPWEACFQGLRIYLTFLAPLVARGIDVADRDQVEIYA